jgi:putative copper export protein
MVALKLFFMTVGLLAFVLGLALIALYRLNKAVDQSDR